MSSKLKLSQDQIVKQPKFSVGDRVRLVEDWCDDLKAGAEGIVRDPSKRFYSLPSPYVDVLWDRSHPAVTLDVGHGDGGYYEDQLELAETAEVDDLTRGYDELCSTYRACKDANGAWVIEATRVKTIARCADEAEANRIAQALNDTVIEAF